MFVLNLVTAGMDVIAIALALAFTHAWGQRIPAWLVLPPAWVATGLLVKFVLAVPLITAAGMLMGRSLPDPGGPVRSWVYVLVYTEFVGMGMGLAAAFVAYARVRWSGAFDSTANAVTHRTRRVQVPLANSAALMAGAVGALHLGWALGATLGVPGEIAAGRTFASTVVNFVDGATMIGGAIASSCWCTARAARISGCRSRSHGSEPAFCSRGDCGGWPTARQHGAGTEPAQLAGLDQPGRTDSAPRWPDHRTRHAARTCGARRVSDRDDDSPRAVVASLAANLTPISEGPRADTDPDSPGARKRTG